MEEITLFVKDNLDWYLLLIIVFGGIFITKYTQGIKIKNTHKVLIASIIFSGLFYVINECKSECFAKYLFTYLFATSFYELIVKVVVSKIQKALGLEPKKTAGNDEDKPPVGGENPPIGG